jgi:UDP-N-acetylmuramate dehydrogenase
MSDIFDGFEHIVRADETLAKYTTLGIGGPAEFFAEPTSVDELSALIKIARKAELPLKLLGGGSNLLVRDEGVSGLVIHLAAPAFCSLEVDGDSLTASGGCRLSHLISAASREGFAGPECLTGIPGTVGGALHGNADAAGQDIGQWVQSAQVMRRDGEIFNRSGNEINFSYRQSSLSELVILSARFRFQRGEPNELAKRLQKQWIVCKSTQPQAGERVAYVFKDSGGSTANNLLEQAGLKGSRMGEVELYQRNLNFFIAHPGATSADVLRLIDVCISQVSNRLGIELESGITLW